MAVGATEAITGREDMDTIQYQRIDPSDLPGLIAAESQHRALLIADLEDPNLSDDEKTALQGGIALADCHLQEYTFIAKRHLRAAQVPGYGHLYPGGDLGPRFAAARWVDQVDLYQTLTGSAAVKSGRDRHRICCPFHDDQTPSLVMYLPGRGWHCFTCGVGGSPVDFVMRLRHLNAVEALLLIEEIADTCGDAWKAS